MDPATTVVQMSSCVHNHSVNIGCGKCMAYAQACDTGTVDGLHKYCCRPQANGVDSRMHCQPSVIIITELLKSINAVAPAGWASTGQAMTG